MKSGFNVGYEPRMVVSWMPGGGGQRVHGVVMRTEDRELSVVMLRAAGRDTKFYDKGGSNEQRDCDNVLMASCPPPGTVRCTQSPVGKCYVFARKDRMAALPLADAGFIRLRLEDAGKKISERDYRDILDHMWRDEKQAARPVRQVSAFDQLIASLQEPELQPGDDYQFGG